MSVRRQIITISILLLTATQAQAHSSEPKYKLYNNFSEPINVKIFKYSGKLARAFTIKPDREVSIPQRCLHLIVETPKGNREYLVPSVLNFVLSSKKNEGPLDYQPVINGRWRLIVSSDSNLSIQYLGDISPWIDLPDFNSPVLFPLRARRSDETLDEYDSDLTAQLRKALRIK